MKVKVRKILLCVFFALFIVTLFTASFSLGRYSSVQSSESNYDDDFEYTLYDSIVVNTIDEFFAAISNGYNYIIIGDAIKDPLIIAGSMSDIRDDLIIDLNGHEIQRNSRDPLLNVTTGFTLTIIDRVGTGSMYNPVGSVIQVSGGTLTVQNGIFESGPRSDDSRDAKRHNDVNVNDYNEYVKDTPDDDELYSTPGGGSISDTDYTVTDNTDTNGTAKVTVHVNQNIDSENSDNQYNEEVLNVSMPIITPKTVIRYPDADDYNKTVISGSMYFDSGTWTNYNQSPWPYITNDTYLYYTFESDNMQYSTAADKSTANYYYQYYVEGGELDENGNYPSGYFNYVGTEREETDNIRVTVYVFNDVKYYADEQSGYTDSSGTSGFAAVKMQSGNLYVRGGTYYSYFGEENTYCVESTGGLMSVNPTGSNAIYFYAYQNGVCVECTVDKPTENEMLNISNGSFYSELGDTVRVANGNMSINSATFTKDASSSDIEDKISTENLQDLTAEDLAELYSYNKSVVNISGGTLTINTSATVNVYGSGVTGVMASSGATVNTNNATFNFYGAGNNTLDASFTRGVYTEGGNVTFNGTTNIYLAQTAAGGQEQSLTSRYNVGVRAGSSGEVKFNGDSTIEIGGNTSPSGGNYGIYSAGGTITFGETGSDFTTNITIAENSASTGNYGIHSAGGNITIYGITEIALGNADYTSIQNYGIYSAGGTVSLGAEGSETDEATITINGDSSSSSSNFGIQTVGGTINAYGTAAVTVYGTSSAGVLSQVDAESMSETNGLINISGESFTCTVDMGSDNVLSSTALSTINGNIQIDAQTTLIESNGLGISAGNGNLTFGNGLGATNTATVNTSRGTAVYVYDGGDLTINSEVVLTVNSQIAQGTSWSADEEGNTNTGVNIYNGVYVRGGSLNSQGTLNVTHVGLKNDDVGVQDGDNSFLTKDNLRTETDDRVYDSAEAYYRFVIKSYAVRVEGGDAETEVTITSGTIRNSVGGGLFVSGSDDTVVKLDNSQDNSAVSIITTGTEAFSDYCHVSQASTNWSARLPQTGGHAVQVTGGNLYINGGTYNATLGNGILLTEGNITVNDGTIVGGDHTYRSSDGNDKPCGAAASYCLKVCGGTININGGTFGSEPVLSNGNYENSPVTSSGAFVMGTSATNRGTANITNGTFNVAGQAAFSVYQYATVEFDEQDEDDEIFVRGFAAGLTVENSPESPIFVTIYDGEFRGYRSGGGDGIWFGNRYALTRIFGGQFIGETRYGLNIDNGGRLQISGGTIRGEQYGINVSLTRLVDAPMAIDSTDGTVGDTVLDISGTAKISGGTGGIYVPRLYAENTEQANRIKISDGTIEGTYNGSSALRVNATALLETDAITVEGGTFSGYHGLYYEYDTDVLTNYPNYPRTFDGSLLIQGGTFNGNADGGYGLYLGSALISTNIVHITSGTFIGYYGGYYGVDGAQHTATEDLACDDGLLIEGGEFRGTQYGFYFNENPWNSGPYNNVAIVGGTFIGNTRAMYTSQGANGICDGDIFQMHTGTNQYYAEVTRYSDVEGTNRLGTFSGNDPDGGGTRITEISGVRFDLERTLKP